MVLLGVGLNPLVFDDSFVISAEFPFCNKFVQIEAQTQRDSCGRFPIPTFRQEVSFGKRPALFFLLADGQKFLRRIDKSFILPDSCMKIDEKL